jgi:hypothetical protein
MSHPRSRPAAAALAAALALASTATAQEKALRIAVHNDMETARPGETVEVPAALFAPALGDKLIGRVRAVEEPSGREILVQAIDLDNDLVVEQLVFQADFAAKEAKTFRLSVGERRAYRKEDFKVYGRFVRERFDDFAWENDRVAFRVYGEALETWQREPLTSSAVDAWSKKTARLVANEWYMVDDYHHDHGEGGDFYPAGKSRGCGGSGLWQGGALVVSKNSRGSRVLAAGPIRLVFELDYPAWERPGVRETKRVMLDAGSQMNRYESVYETGGTGPVAWAAGTKVEKGASTRADRANGIVRSWEHQTRYGENGWLGCGLVAEPGAPVEVVEHDGNLLIVGKAAAGRPARYYAGSGWDGSGLFKDAADWDRYLDAFAARLRSPLRVEIAKE